MDDVIFVHDGQKCRETQENAYIGLPVLNATQQAQHGFDTMAHSQAIHQGARKMADLKLADLKMTDQIVRETGEIKLAELKMADQK